MDVKKGYKLTEVGVIPKDWEVTSLANLIKLRSGFAFKSEFFSTRGPVVLTPGNFSLEGGLYFNDRNTKRYSGDFPLSMKFSIGDLLIVMTDLTPDCNLLGKPAIVHLTETILHNQRIGKVSIVSKSIFKKHLYYVLLSERYLSAIKESATGSTVRHTSSQSIYSFKTLLPPLPEQRAISEALSDVDALLVKQEQMLAKKRDIKQGAMQQLLTGKQRLPGFKKSWFNLNMLRDSVLKARIGWQGLTTAEYRESGDAYLVTGTEMTQGRVDWSACCFVDRWRYAQDPNIQLRVGDVLMSKDGTIGKVAYVDRLPGPATLNSGVFVIRPRQEAYDPKYFYYVLMSRVFDLFLSQLQAGSTINHLYQKDFVSFSFSAPEIAEQTAIASVLSDMDAEIAVLERQREKTRELKQGMMQELLTGRIRLV